ncbi:MAG: hypothetical protein WB402_05200 [Sulfuricaulis sp.]|uniref:hypothetical protein n=1 Tax=Sulfuricaulis sp. TaxID=2003553 RepID=UPI003C4E56D2
MGTGVSNCFRFECRVAVFGGRENYFILAPPPAFLISGSPEGERAGGMDGRAVIFLPRAPRPENLIRKTTDPPRIVNRRLISTI